MERTNHAGKGNGAGWYLFSGIISTLINPSNESEKLYNNQGQVCGEECLLSSGHECNKAYLVQESSFHVSSGEVSKRA